MPPYWALGFQLCRYGYRNTSQIREAVERTRNASIPHVRYVELSKTYMCILILCSSSNQQGLRGSNWQLFLHPTYLKKTDLI